MKKALIYIIVILVVIGGLMIIFHDNSKKNIEDVINNMEVSESNINGYNVDVLIVGSNKGNRYNIRKRITNYLDKQYRIIVFDDKKRTEYVIQNDKFYTYASKKLTEVEPFEYIKPNEYLISMDKITKTKTENQENNMDKYSFTISSDTVKKILKLSEIDVEVNNSINGILLVENDYVKEVKYIINDDLYISIQYSNLDDTSMLDIDNILKQG